MIKYIIVLITKSKKNITGALYRCDLDGKNKTKILNKAVFYPYIIQISFTIKMIMTIAKFTFVI